MLSLNSIDAFLQRLLIANQKCDAADDDDIVDTDTDDDADGDTIKANFIRKLQFLLFSLAYVQNPLCRWPHFHARRVSNQFVYV